MPVRHRTNFQPRGEVKKCPRELHAKLRDPRCRVEPKPFEPHNKPIGPYVPGYIPKPKPTPVVPVGPFPPNPPGPGGGGSFPYGLVIGGELGGAALGAGAGLLARKALQSAYRAKISPEEGGETEMEDFNLRGGEGEAELMDEPNVEGLPKPAGGSQDIDAEFDPAESTEAIDGGTEEAGQAVEDFAQGATQTGGEIEMGVVDSDAINISLGGVDAADATAGFSGGVTSFGSSIAQLSSNAVKFGARALRALKPPPPVDDPEASEQLLSEAQQSEAAAETQADTADAASGAADSAETAGEGTELADLAATNTADAASGDIMGDLIGEAIGGAADDIGAAGIEGGIELAELGAQTAGESVAAASGAEAIAAASAAEVAAEAAAAGGAAVAANTATDIAVAEAAAAPFDFETFGVSAAVAAGTGAAVGAAAAAGILAAIIPAFIAGHKQKPSATQLTSAQETASIAALQAKVATTPSVQATLTMAKKAVADGRKLYSVYDGKNTMLISQLSQTRLAEAAANYEINTNLFKGVSPEILKAMGLSPALTNGRLIVGGFYNSNVSNPPTSAMIAAANPKTAKATAATDQTSLNTAKANLAALKAKQSSADTLSATDKTALATAQQNVVSAQANIASAKQNALSYNNTLSSALQTEYINDYVNTVDTDRATNVKIDTGTVINPNSLYNSLSVAGGGGTAPSIDLNNIKGISFVNGQPVFSSQLQQQAQSGFNSALQQLQQLQKAGAAQPPPTQTANIPTTGTSANQKPASANQQVATAINNQNPIATPVKAITTPAKPASSGTINITRPPTTAPAPAPAPGGGINISPMPANQM